MNKIQAYWNKKIAEGHNLADVMHQSTGFTYRVYQSFVGICIDAWSVDKSKWMTVKVIR